MTNQTTRAMSFYSMETEFNLAAVNVPAGTQKPQYQGYAEGLPHVPQKNGDYYFDRERLRDMFAFWTTGERALKIKGDPAAGKTSLVTQFHARMRAPLLIYSCSNGTEAHHLFGQLVPQTDHTLKWIDGPVLSAARNGYSVLLDEWNTLDPSVATSLNAILEGYSITIPETGDVITPHSDFRVFATENPVTSMLSVVGRNVQDAASDDRWMVMEVDYLPPDQEQSIIAKYTLSAVENNNEAAGMLAKVLVNTATEVRSQFRNGHACIDKPMSTRVLIRWAKLLRSYRAVSQDGAERVVYAMTRAFSMSSHEMSDAVAQIVRTKFGSVA